jgi:multicomponent Na+:H+ antiporter subunit E
VCPGLVASDTGVQWMNASGNPAGRSRQAGQPRTPRVLAASAAVFVFWLVISASLAPADLLLGASLSVVLGWWSARFLWAGDAPRLRPRQLLALLHFLLGYSRQVLLAALHVARVVIDPRLPIRPAMVVCHTGLQQQISRVAFALAITLTPGTLTVDIDGGTFLVHCLDEDFARQIQGGDLERRIAQIFEQDVTA